MNSISLFGIFPASPYHLLALLVPVIGWLATWRIAKKHHLTVMHNASFAVSYWEELLFRGLAYGLLDAIWHNGVVSIFGSSVLFSLLHLRNIWWASQKRLLFQCAYAGLFIGPITGYLRWLSGDVYFSIAFHAINNFTVIASPLSAPKPSDEDLHAKVSGMRWWQRGIIGFWTNSDET